MNKQTFLKTGILIPVLFLCFGINLAAQDEVPDSTYVFTSIYDHPATVVKDQNRSGTCWAFAGISFVESEILKTKGDTFDLSEMYIVRYAYPAKAERYVRLHGKAVFGAGGQAHDVTNVFRDNGVVPEEVYNGMEIGENGHNHGEMDAVLDGMATSITKRRGGKLTPVWFDAVNAVMDVYLGKAPEEFDYKGVTYSPESFAEMTGFNPDDYVEITSYTHHPFYSSCRLEIPDNWSNDNYYNLPIDDLISVMDYAFEKEYTVCWDGDVSDKGFSHRNGVAIVPDKNLKDLSQTERERWEALTEKEKSAQLYSFDVPGDEKEITQEMRQLEFDNYTATDDHLMHLTGIVEDQNGTRYYKTKNSWAEDSNEFGGYLNMSESYIRLKTVAIMVNKKAVPKEIAKKLGIE